MIPFSFSLSIPTSPFAKSSYYSPPLISNQMACRSSSTSLITVTDSEREDSTRSPATKMIGETHTFILAIMFDALPIHLVTYCGPNRTGWPSWHGYCRQQFRPDFHKCITEIMFLKFYLKNGSDTPGEVAVRLVFGQRCFGGTKQTFSPLPLPPTYC